MRVSNLAARVAVAVVFIPLYVLLMRAGGWPLVALHVGMVVLGAREFCHLGVRPSLLEELVTLGTCGGVVLLLSGGHWGAGAAAAALPFLVVVASDVFAGAPRQTLFRASRACAAVLYVAWLFSHVHLLRLPAPGVARWGVAPWKTGLMPFYLTWTVDTAAYVVGLAVGRRKLAPLISPKKTVEGAVGGFVCGLLAGASLRAWVAIPLPLGLCLGAVVGTGGQVADLVESLLKREAGLKDSSGLIPGHGGVLDRLDSLLFSIPAVYSVLSLWPRT